MTEERLTDKDLLDEWAILEEARQTTRVRMTELEHALFHRMVDRDAREIAHDAVIAKLEPQDTVDRTALDGIRELEGISQERLYEAYTPEHQETVAASWNLTKAKALAKYNGEVTRIIEAARQPLDPRPVFKLKKQA